MPLKPSFGNLLGHGQLGLRSNMRTFKDLLDQSGSHRDILAVVEPVLTVNNWSLSSGNIYVAPFEYTYKGIRRDVKSVSSVGDPNLERAETAAGITSGQYYYQPNEKFNQSIFKWDGGTVEDIWDDGVLRWDQFPQLYINLSDDADPNNTTVVAHLGFHFSTKAQSHPTLGPDILDGIGDFENFTGQTPDGWALGGGDATPSKETSDVFHGTACLKLSLDGTESADYRNVYVDIANPVDTAVYRLSGYYKTVITTGSAVAFIKVQDDTTLTSIEVDGRLLRSNRNLALTDTAGYWRSFCFDFYWDGTHLPNDMRILLAIVKGGGIADLYFDNIKLQRVWRYEFYEPRMTNSSIPATSAGSNDIFFGGKRTSTGGIGFINNDKFFEVAGGQLEWINQRSNIFVGGRFLSDPTDASDADPYTEGQEILFSDMRQAYSGLIQRLKVSDSLAEIDMQDVRTYFHIKLPRRVYADTDFVNLYTTDWQGKVRPIFFGVKTNITPARIDYETSYNKYGKYEICDCTDAPNGIKAVDVVYAYTNKAQADLSDASSRLTLIEDTHYTVDLDLGRFTIDVDVGPYEIIAGENDGLDFTDGVGANTAWLDAGLYTAADLASHIQTMADAESADTITCTYSDSTNQFTIASDGGTLELDIQDGPNKDRSVYKTIGFTDTANKTGATSYTGDDATFTSVDTDHIIRVNAQGYKDDAAGTFTGTGSALIEIGADICKTLLIKFMSRPASSIDTASFEDARSRSTETLTMFIKTSTSSKDIFERLEYSNIANIVIDGEGVVHYEVYTGAVPTNTAVIFDRDIMEFSAQKGYEDIYQTIRVLYDEDPTTGEQRAREATDTSVGVRLGRQDIKEFPTYLKYSDNATSVCNRMLELSKQAARKFTIGVLGGSLIDHKVGDKVRIERDRALGDSGDLRQQSFRILSIKKDYLKGLVTIEVTDDKITVASQACIASCQLFCQINCRLECQQECQSFCQLNCEISCEVSCRDLCQQACQETCQLGCLQVTCELTCQAGGCESVCQNCEGAGCQTNCEASCQTGCEVSCQDDCQLNGCQTVCQLTECQRTCETSCQDNCQLGITCQATCEINSESVDPCDVSCQDACQLTCRDACQLGACQFADEGVT